MKYIYNITGNRISIKHIGTDEEFYQEFGNDIFISDVDLGELAIIDNGKIRAITRLDRVKNKEEELTDGEYIKNDEILTVEKPDNFHIWGSKKKKWIYEKQLEIDFINSEILNKETELNNFYDTLDKATARRLKALIAYTQHKIDKITEELETLENKLKELEV